MRTLDLNIDLSKIDKKNLFVTKDGKSYLNLRLVIRDELDQYDGIGFAVQKFLKGNDKDAQGGYIKTPILGNLKDWAMIKAKDDSAGGTFVEPMGDDPEDDDLPF
jgi:hypothetical protein